MNKLSKRLACIVTVAALTVSILPTRNVYAADEKKEAYMIGNAHIDAAWNWRYAETIEQCIPDTFNSALSLMERDKDYHFTASSSQLYKWVDEYYPEMAPKIKEKVDAGQWDIAGGQVCEPDLNVPSGESLVRQSLYAQKYFEKTFGKEKRPQVGFVPDVFGFTYNMPQILKKSGMDYFLTTKLNWNDTTKWPYEVFKWKAPDGSEVLVDKPTHDYSWHNFSSWEMSGIVDKPSEMGLKTGIALYGSGDHGGGPTYRDIGEIKDAYDVSTKMANTIDAFKALEADVNAHSDKVPVVDNELYLQKHRGVYTTAGPMKKYNRMSEIKAEETEKFASIAYLFNNIAYPQEKITKAWERTALNQFHDVLPGSSIASVYVDAYNDAEIALNHLNKSMGYALDTLKARINTEGKGVPIVAFNALSWDRKNLIQTEVTFPNEVSKVKIVNDKNEEIPCQIMNKEGNKAVVAFEAEVPAVGYSVYRALPESGSNGYGELKADKDALTMENKFLRVVINKDTGNISSIYDKVNSREVFEDGKEGNVLQYLEDTPREYHAWDLDRDDMQREAKDINNVESIQLIENGSVKTTFRVTRKWSSSKFVQDITLYADSDKVDIKNNIDWDEHDICLKVAFPMNVKADKATYEIAYAAIERPTTNDYREEGMFEVSGHKWADMSKDGYGVSILNDSKYGWDALDSRLRLTLLRAAHDRGGDSDRGQHHEFTYSIYPHSGDWKEANTVQKGYEFNYPIIAQQASIHKGDLESSKSFMSVDKDNVVISVLKKAEDSDDMIVRVYESKGKEGTTATLQLPANIKEVKEVNLIEEEVDEPSQITTNGNKLTTPVNKYEIKTFRVKLEKPDEFKDAKIESEPIDLSGAFNLDGMSYDLNREDGNFNGNNECISADLMPDKVVTEDVEFNIGPKEDGKNNFVQANGQIIDVESKSHKYLYILGCATDESNAKGEFKVNYSDGTSNSKELVFADWKAQVGNMLNTYIDDNIGISLTHTHKSSRNTYDIDNNLYVYKIGIDSSKEVKSIVLPKSEGIKIAAMSFVDGELLSTPDVEPPSKVNIKAETPRKNNSPYVILSWEEASDNVGVEKYIIYRAAKEDMSDAKVIGETSATTYKDENMNVPTKYYYMVKAKDAEGNTSEASNVVTALGGDIISIGKIVESSSSSDCTNVIDGDSKTKWTAYESGESWITLDLKEALPISKFVIKHDGDKEYNTRDFKIQISNDKINWSDIVDVKNNDKSVTEHDGKGAEGRYVRLLITKPCADTCWSKRATISEFEVHGDEVAPATKAPEKASNITNIVQDENSLIINYEYVPKTESYIIRYGEESGKYDKEIKDVKGTSYRIDGLVQGKTYYFKIIPINSIGAGPESEEKSFKLEIETIVKVDLSKDFNLDGMSTLDNPKDGEFDGVGWAYDGDAIPDNIKVDKINFKMGSRKGTDKNVVVAQGQDIVLPNVKAESLYFLGAAHEGDQSGTFVVNYEDGTKEEKLIRLTDWCKSPNSEEKLALNMDHRIANGKRGTEGSCGPAVNIKMYSIPLDVSKKVKSIALPNSKYIKVFAITLDARGEVSKEQSKDARLSGITIGEKALEDFDANTLEYTYELGNDAEEAPMVAATTEDVKASVKVTQADSVNGTASIVVTAEDGKTIATYKVKFNKPEAPKPEGNNNNAKLKGITIDGKALKGFKANIFEYNYVLESDVTEVPVIDAEGENSKASVKITQADDVNGTASIVVTAEDGKTTATYKVKFSRAEAPKPGENVMEIENLSNVTSFKAGKEAKIVLEARNNSSVEQNATLVVALFNQNGNFVRYIATEQRVLPNTTIKLKGMMSLLGNETGYSIKCFVWDSFEEMNELSNKIEIPVVK